MIIDRERFIRAREIFTEAVSLAGGERERRLAAACGDDPALRAEVERLLAWHRDRDDTLDASWQDALAASSWPTEPALPAAIGPWRVLDLIGQGGMGVVYRARDAQGGPDAPVVAVKVLRAGVANAQAERRFRREVEVLRRLDHPGIARLLDAGTADGAPYLVMEYVAGMTLTRWREAADRPLEDRLRLLAELADAVQHAHAHDIIHRDLKPENILVDEDGHPKVLDFGIARLDDQAAPAQTLATQTWQLLGTIRYMSPEQATGGPAAIDARTDIYALGVLGYELLTGRMPYDLNRLSTPRALLEITTAGARQLGAADPRLRGNLELIIAHALEKQPKDRYQTAAALAADLRRHLAGQPVSLRRPGALAVARRELAMRPRLRRLTATLVVAALAALAMWMAMSRAAGARAVTWGSFYELVDEADRRRHNGPQTSEDWQATIALFERARVQLAQLPPEPQTVELNRFIRWRLGELHFFIGELEHDREELDVARSFWREASMTPWARGAVANVDQNAVSRVTMSQLGRHHPSSGLGYVLGSLSRFGTPASTWREAVLHQHAALVMQDEDQNYHPGSATPSEIAKDHVYVRLNLGGALAALGATVDSLAVIGRGLAWIGEAARMPGLDTPGGRAHVQRAWGAACLDLAQVSPIDGGASPRAAWVDSARLHLDRARELAGPGGGRGFWHMCRLRARAATLEAATAASATAREAALARAESELRDALAALHTGVDAPEIAVAQADLGEVLARRAADRGDPAAFASADSLLGLAAAALEPRRYPVWAAELELQRAGVARLRFGASGAAADSLAAATALERAALPVPRVEYPALHRRLEEERARLTRGA